MVSYPLRVIDPKISIGHFVCSVLNIAAESSAALAKKRSFLRFALSWINICGQSDFFLGQDHTSICIVLLLCSNIVSCEVVWCILLIVLMAASRLPKIDTVALRLLATDTHWGSSLITHRSIGPRTDFYLLLFSGDWWPPSRTQSIDHSNPPCWTPYDPCGTEYFWHHIRVSQ